MLREFLMTHIRFEFDRKQCNFRCIFWTEIYTKGIYPLLHNIMEKITSVFSASVFGSTQQFFAKLYVLIGVNIKSGL